MLNAAEPALQTKRQVIGHVVMCSGCCCGKTERGKPEVPVEWLKAQWKARGLLKNIQLSISGCLGPCDLQLSSIGLRRAKLLERFCRFPRNLKRFVSILFSAKTDWQMRRKSAEEYSE
jgi:hypothetical protein